MINNLFSGGGEGEGQLYSGKFGPGGGRKGGFFLLFSIPSKVDIL